MHANASTEPAQVSHAAVALALEAAAHDVQTGRLAEAEGVYRGVLEEQPHQAEANYRLATLLSQRDGLDGALPYYVMALRSDERQPKYWLALATALLAQDRLADAKSLLARFAALGFSDAPAKEMTAKLVALLFSKARAHHQGGRIGDAELLYDTILMLDSAHAPSLLGAALAANTRGERNDAVALLRLAIAADDTLVAGHANLARLLFDGGVVTEALDHAERALSLDPGFPGPQGTRLAALYALGRAEEAIAGYREATAEEPDRFRGNRDLEGLVRHVRKLDTGALRPGAEPVARPPRAPRRTHEGKNDVFYIASPGYSYLSGGPLALHLLCHHLNELGYEAYMFTDRVSETLNTPVLTQAVMDSHRESGRRRIGIYPEIELSNCLNCDRVIRFLLNAPGARTTADDRLRSFWAAPERQHEYILHFAEEFQVPYLKSHPLFLPLVDESIYHRAHEPKPRTGFLVYSHRRRVTPDMIPDWAKPYTMIEMANYRTPEELAELYQSSEALVVFERTGAIGEALLCGCPVVAVPSESFKDLPMFSRSGNLGVGWGQEREQLDWAKRSLEALCNVHRAYVVAAPTEVRQRVEDALEFFDAGEPWSL